MPVGGEGQAELDRECAERSSTRLASRGRTILTEFESKQLLACYGIPTVETRIAKDPERGRAAANAIGYPVVLKLHSETITHKTDVGGVQLNLADADAVRKAYSDIEKSVAEKAGAEHFLGVTVQPMAKVDGYELIIGSSIDPQFGPVLLFGLGGQLVEVFKDRALGLPPLNTTLARRMMEQTKIYTALERRARPRSCRSCRARAPARPLRTADHRTALDQGNGHQSAHGFPEKLIALDARVVLYDKDTKEEQLPKLAIRPYPMQYVGTWTAKDKTKVTIRPFCLKMKPCW